MMNGTHSWSTRVVLVPALTAALAIGCAATPGARPHDMSVEGHEAMARQDSAEAVAHDAKHDPGARVETEHCRLTHHGDRTFSWPLCWTSTTNPTARHRQDAERHRKMAADHRAAAASLQEAEARACAGIGQQDRDTSPFYHREDILRVEETPAHEAGGGAGMAVVFRKLPGLTAEAFQRVIDCHLARNASLGHAVPEMEYCPLVLRGVRGTVTEAADGLVVDLQFGDPETADESRRRVRQLPER